MAPAKAKEADFYVDNSGEALANSWLDQMRSSSGKAEEEVEEDDDGGVLQDARPSRLGLGAKFLPHSMALKTNDPAAARLENKLKGQKKKGEAKFEEAKLARSKFGHDDEDESRTKAVKKPKVEEKKQPLVVPAVQKQDAGDAAGKKKKKKKKNQNEGGGEPSGETGAKKSVEQGKKKGAGAGAASQVAPESEAKGNKKRRAEEEAVANDQLSKKEPSSTPKASLNGSSKKAKLSKVQKGEGVKGEKSNASQVDGWGEEDGDSAAAQNEEQSKDENGEVGKRRPLFDDPEGYVHKPRRKRVKGKKTRSKQKNLKKDTRPAHLKPGYEAPK